MYRNITWIVKLTAIKKNNVNGILLCFVLFCGAEMVCVRDSGCVEVCGLRGPSASPVIGANAAFNKRTKEELEMHMF